MEESIYQLPTEMLAVRRRLARTYICGNGIEIGALHQPLETTNHAQVRYLDRLNVEELRNHYPELASLDLVQVDILDDGERLSTVSAMSLDFIIANHFLEHTQNPIATIESHLARIREDGYIYYSIPDRDHGFDKDRNLTSFEHVQRDYQEGPGVSHEEHLREWVTLVNKASPDQVATQMEQLKLTNYSIHFHVWDGPSFAEFLEQTRVFLGRQFDIVEMTANMNEHIAILKKCGTLISTRRRLN